jgi:DNA-binding LytR/AlgR family response regulator
MKVLIIEDEMPAARRLKRMLSEMEYDFEFLGIIDTVKESQQWLNSKEQPDLLFMDIHLADGRSTQIFDQIPLSIPVIFTTAFDKYVLEAFKINSIDYLLKPIDSDSLQAAIQKVMSIYQKSVIDSKTVESIKHIIENQIKYKEALLLKKGERYLKIRIQDICLFQSEDGYSFIHTTDGKKHIYDVKMDDINSELNPNLFFRINRGAIISKGCLKDVRKHVNGRLKITFLDKELIVSRERAKEFKHWMTT